jgi:hypothetical protein
MLGALALGLLTAALVILLMLNTDTGERARWWIHQHSATPVRLFLWAIAFLFFFPILQAFVTGHHETRLLVTAMLAVGTVIFFTSLFVMAWVRSFLFLMTLRDEDLPGRHDKLIWAIALLVFAPVGLWLFRSFSASHWPHLEPQSSTGAPVKGPAMDAEV